MSTVPAFKPRRTRPRGRRGFTLLEVVLAVAILALLAGGVTGIVRMALSSTAEIEETESRTRAFAAFFELCERSFSSLPAGASISRTASPAEGFASALPAEVVFREAPAAFAIDDHDLFFGEIALAVRPQPDGDLVLGTSYRRIDRQTGQTVPPDRWIPLLRNLRSVEWSFYDFRTGKWQAGWTDTAQRPGLVRVTIAPADGFAKQTAVFRLPPLVASPQSPGKALPEPAPAPTPPKTS